MEFYKPMVLKLGADRVAVFVASATRNRAAFAPIFILHVQDEADIRLRSKEGDNLPGPNRSRTSKVQQHVVELVAVHGSLDIPTEMEALGDKTAATLCINFERLVRHIAAGVLPSTGGGAQPQASVAKKPQADIWLFHIIVGDGIATNEAAAKRLWACLQKRELGDRVRYLLVVIICDMHQAGLTAKSTVAGRAATAAARGELYKGISGVAVRLYKYLIND